MQTIHNNKRWVMTILLSVAVITGLLVIPGLAEPVDVDAVAMMQEKTSGKKFYALDDSTCIWRAWGTRKVSSTPRTATVQGVAGDTITLTTNDAYYWGDWGASPAYMHEDNVYAMIRDTTRGENAWVEATPAGPGGSQLRVTNAADIVGWQNGDTVSTWSEAAASPQNYETLDISNLVPDGATLVFLKAQVLDTGGAVYAIGLQVSKQGVSGTWSNVFISRGTPILVCYYPQCLITTDRHMTVRDRATGVKTLQHSISVIGYIR